MVEGSAVRWCSSGRGGERLEPATQCSFFHEWYTLPGMTGPPYWNLINHSFNCSWRNSNFPLRFAEQIAEHSIGITKYASFPTEFAIFSGKKYQRIIPFSFNRSRKVSEASSEYCTILHFRGSFPDQILFLFFSLSFRCRYNFPAGGGGERFFHPRAALRKKKTENGGEDSLQDGPRQVLPRRAKYVGGFEVSILLFLFSFFAVKTYTII